MCYTKVKFTRELNINELREVLSLMEQQETTDQYRCTFLQISGNYAKIAVDIDENGNIIVL